MALQPVTIKAPFRAGTIYNVGEVAAFEPAYAAALIAQGFASAGAVEAPVNDQPPVPAMVLPVPFISGAETVAPVGARVIPPPSLVAGPVVNGTDPGENDPAKIAADGDEPQQGTSPGVVRQGTTPAQVGATSGTGRATKAKE